MEVLAQGQGGVAVGRSPRLLGAVVSEREAFALGVLLIL
jgi:hypothetical protein